MAGKIIWIEKINATSRGVFFLLFLWVFDSLFLKQNKEKKSIIK